MAKKDNELSAAEQYRKERKERIAKANAAAGKKGTGVSLPPVNKKRNRVISIVIIILAVLLIAVGLVFFFGVPQQLNTVMTINGEKISEAEFTYYYKSAYNYTVQMNSYLSQYGISSDSSFDSTKAPSAQEYNGTTELEAREDGQPNTWQDYFVQQAIDELRQQIAICQKATEEGITLDETDQADIEAQLTEIETSANENDFSLDAYLRAVYGRGVGEKILREVFERNALVTKYQEAKTEELGNQMTAEEVQAAYDADKDAYDTADIRVRVFSTATSSTDDEAAAEQALTDAQDKANQILEAATDEAGFIQAVKDTAAEDEAEDYADDNATLMRSVTKSTVSSQVSSDVADWAFATERQAGDKTVITGDNAVYVVYVVTPRHLSTDGTRTVRHILINYEEDADDASKQATKDEAQKILDEFNNGDKTEAAFAELAVAKSEDSGSSSNGGLYEDIYRGQMVIPFEDWCFDPARQAGDTGLVESSYGVHVMYFVSADDTPYYEQQIRDDKGSEGLTDAINEISDAATVEKDTAKVDKVADRCDDDIQTSLNRSNYN